MFDFTPGISLSSITDSLIWSEINALRNSGIATFELYPGQFAADYDRAVRNGFRAMLRETGKRAAAYHIPFTRSDDLSDPDQTFRRRALSRLRALLDEAAFFGAELIVLHPSTEPIDQSGRHTRLSRLRDSMMELEAELKSREMRLALELLPRRCMGNSLSDLQAMLTGFDDTFGCCLDVNHLMGDHAKLPEIVRALGKRLINLHISDYDGIDERHWLPFSGVIDWPEFLRALREINYRGPFNYEVRNHPELPTEDWLAAIESNMERMKRAID